jgi:hypothetical protein
VLSLRLEEGELVTRRRSGRRRGALVAGLLALGLGGHLAERARAEGGFKLADPPRLPERLAMLPFDQALARAREAKRPIFAFFTAKW